MWLRDVTRGRSFGKSPRLAGEIDLSDGFIPETGEHVRPIRTALVAVVTRPRPDVTHDEMMHARERTRTRASRSSVTKPTSNFRFYSRHVSADIKAPNPFIGRLDSI